MISWKKNVSPQGIYIHWPFCKNKCQYCDFISFAKHEGFEGSYHKALLSEIENFSKELKIKNRLQTIFLGGGSPSLYPLHLLEELVATLRKCFDLSELKEFTIECNPADVTEEKLKIWKKSGINRLSIGIQVLDEAVLKNLNRRQKNAIVFNLMQLAPKYFDNISVDLILGLPGVSDEVCEKTLKTLAFWNINHISIYFLTVYDKTKLYFRVKKGELVLPDEGELIILYKKTVEMLKQYGFEQYEISNFAKPGFESLHNVGYWDLKPYKGFGLSAASFDGENRFVNYKNLSKYLKNSVVNASGEVDKLSEEQKKMEFLMLKLRQRKGVDLRDVLYLLRDFSKHELLKKIKDLQFDGLLKINNNKISLTLKGMFIENEIVLNLLS